MSRQLASAFPDEGGTEAGPRELRATPDHEVTQAARAGSVTAFEELYRRHHPAAKAAARYLVRNDADADDVVSEAFAGVLHALRNGGGPREDNFRAYLLACVRNGSALRGRQRGRNVPVDPADFEKGAMAFEDPDRFVDGDAVTTAYSSLPSSWQRVLWLTEVEDRPLGEVADALNMPRPAAAALSHRAHQGLAEAYLGQAIDHGARSGTCARVAPQLARYVRGRCKPSQLRLIRNHVDECVPCRTLVDELRGVNHRLRALVLPPLAIAAFLADRHEAHGAAAQAVANAATNTAASTAGAAGAGATSTAAARLGHGWWAAAKLTAVVSIAAVSVAPEFDQSSRVGAERGAQEAGIDAAAASDATGGSEPDITSTVVTTNDASGGSAPIVADTDDPPLTASSALDPTATAPAPTESATDTVVAPPAAVGPPGEPSAGAASPVDVPPVGSPAIDLPAVDLPSIELPSIELPSIELPSIELPAVDLPVPGVEPVVVPPMPAVIPPTVAPVVVPPVVVPPVVTPPPASAGPIIDLGAAASFAALANTTVTFASPSTIIGQVGSGAGAVTGLSLEQLLQGGLVAGPAAVIAAQLAATGAVSQITSLFSAPVGFVELGGQTFGPGVRHSGTTSLTGTVTLDGGGDPNAVFVFRTATTLITASSSRVVLTGGARPCNVFWQVGSSATFGTNTSFAGNVIAGVSITATTGATFAGRLIARTGAITMDGNTVDASC